MIVGHTVQHGAIKQRCGGRLIMIDTGLSYMYDANPSALRSLRNETMAVYPSIDINVKGHPRRNQSGMGRYDECKGDSRLS